MWRGFIVRRRRRRRRRRRKRGLFWLQSVQERAGVKNIHFRK
jgi:hypothetical protein